MQKQSLDVEMLHPQTYTDLSTSRGARRTGAVSAPIVRNRPEARNVAFIEYMRRVGLLDVPFLRHTIRI